jgi:hypothetical protein
VGSGTAGAACAWGFTARRDGELWVDYASTQAERTKIAPAERIEKRRIYGRL